MSENLVNYIEASTTVSCSVYFRFNFDAYVKCLRTLVFTSGDSCELSPISNAEGKNV